MSDPYFTSGTNGRSRTTSTTLKSKYPQLLALFERIQFDSAETFYSDFACKEYDKNARGVIESTKISEADVLENLDRLPRFTLINRNIVNSAEWKLSIQYMSNRDEIVVAQWFATIVDRQVSDAVKRCNYFNDIASLDLDRSIFDRIVPHEERSDSISISYEQFQDVARDKLYWELWRKLSNAGIIKSSETSPRSIEKRIPPVSFDISDRSAAFKERYAPLISKDGTTMTLAAWHAVWLFQKSLNSIGIQTPQDLKEFSGYLGIELTRADLFNGKPSWLRSIKPYAKK